MRLLKRAPDGGLELVLFSDDNLPPYAILSHTWAEGQEVSYHELVAGTGKDKTGYKKVNFCVDKADQDGLQYSWVDTCCIDKSSSAELSEAINSMFRWYQRADKCYVYLSDVEVPSEVTDAQTDPISWEATFRQSRWFTRGWTLQELLAPATVEFFSKEGRRLGSGTSLEQVIHEITEVPITALKGQRLGDFSVEERMSWAARRTTTLEEDKVYCLLGIYGVFLPLIYGEGEAYARQRLEKEVQRRQKGHGTAHVRDLTVSLSLPFPRNELFVGREDQLRSLERFIDSSTPHHMTIYGLGGCGKSALALELAYRALIQDAGRPVFWVPAISRQSFELALRETAIRLRVPRISENNADIKQLVKKALSSDSAGRWLMIVDNVDDLGILADSTGVEAGSARLQDCLPRSDRGKILFTTRSRKAAEELTPSHVLELDDMSKAEARQLLAGRMSKPALLDEEKAVDQLLKSLEYLPLAIVQAAVFINTNDVSMSEYLSLFRTAGTETELLGEHFENPSRYKEPDSTVTKTREISFEQVRMEDPTITQADALIRSNSINVPPMEQTGIPMGQIDRAMIRTGPVTNPNTSENDSGYGSAPHPVMSTVPSEPILGRYAIGEYDRTDNCDIQSLISQNDDIHSQVSTQGVRASLTGEALICVYLVENTQFRNLCKNALARIDKQRFSENLRRLLRTFHKNLSSEARTEGEKAVATILQQRQVRLRISQRLITRIEAEQVLANADLGVATEDTLFLEKWLANVANAPTDLPEQLINDRDSGDESTKPEAQDEFPFISELKRFLGESESFKSLIRDFMLWLLPIDLREVLLSIPRDCIWVSRNQDFTLTNLIKAWVEDSTKVRWIWWPLEARKRKLLDHENRLFWRCTCGKRQWLEISIEHGELLKGVLELMSDNPPSPYQCLKRSMRVPLIAYFTDAFRMVPAATAAMSSTATSRYTPSDITTSPLPFSCPGSQYSAVLPNSSGKQTAPCTASQAQTVQGASNQAQSYILFGVQGGRRRLVPSQIPIYEHSTDSSVFKEIRRCYQAQRGKVRLWFSIWRLEYCAVVKFNRLGIKDMVHEYRDLPKQQDYQYDPRAGHPDAKNPPLSPHLFEALYYTCPLPCKKWFPHYCSSPPNGATTIIRFPKRVKSFQTDQTKSIWGLEALFAISAAHVIAYHLILVAFPFAFFGWWVGAHPWDLQNASVPATIAGAALSLLWMVSGILTSENLD